VANFRHGGITQGGSTINQQLIKSKFLTQDRTYRRKFFEVVLAVILDARMSKDEILEAYLNDVYLGHYRGRPILGVDEASRIFFDKRPALLRIDEAALLAGIIRAPNRDTPDKRPELARSRRDAILATMRDQGWISDSEYRTAAARTVVFRHGSLRRQPYPFYLPALRTELVRELGAGALNRPGLTLVAEIDPAMQSAAEEAAVSGVARLRSRYSWIRRGSEPLQVAILSVDPGSGGVRALVGGATAETGAYDRTARMRRQPGSAFKTFAYLAAIESRQYTPASLLLDAPLRVQLTGNRTWEPHNYDERFRGRVTVREAFEESLNVPTIRMTDEVGLARVVRTVEDFGFSADFERVPALPLGVTEVTVRELTGAYTAFPNLGERVEPYLLREVRDRKGETIFTHKAKREKVIDPGPAFVVHSMLRGVVRRGTASRLKRYGLGHVAGKTGTTSAYRDAWFVGYAPDLVTTVWVGHDRGTPIRLSSAEAALPIWGSYMREVKTSRRELKEPEGVTNRNIDPESGYLWAEGCPGPVKEYFLVGTQPTRGCPRGFFGQIARRILFDKDRFDEPPAITFDKFRRWTIEVEQGRRRMETRVEKFERAMGGRKKKKE
jgi:penicillin-binding protein 1B